MTLCVQFIQEKDSIHFPPLMSLFLLSTQQTVEFNVSLTSANYEYEIRPFS